MDTLGGLAYTAWNIIGAIAVLAIACLAIGFIIDISLSTLFSVIGKFTLSAELYDHQRRMLAESSRAGDRAGVVVGEFIARRFGRR